MNKGKRLDKIKKLKLSTVVQFLIMLTIGLTFLYPIYYLVTNALKTNNEFYKDPAGLPDFPLQWKNFVVMFKNFKIMNYVKNTLIIVLGSLVMYMPLAVCTSFTFAKYKFRGSNLIYFLMIAGMTMPGQVTAIPIYVGLAKAQLVDTYFGMMLCFLGMTFGATVMMTSFFRGVPTEVLESARMDGCGYFKTLWYMILPMAKPIIAIQTIIGVNNMWNSLFMPQIMLRKDSVKMIMPAIADLVSTFEGSPVHMMAGMLIAIVPTLVVYMIFKKQIVNGITAGAVKG